MKNKSHIENEIKRILWYQNHPNEWAVDYMGVRRETIYWSENSGYESHQWDGSVDPIAAMPQAIADWKKRIAVKSSVGPGKAQPIFTPVLTPAGWKPICGLSLNDSVYGSDGKPHRLLGIYDRGEREVFRVTFSDGTSTRCCKEHLWTVRESAARPWRTMELGEIMAHNHDSWQIPVPEPIHLPESRLPIDPYVMGALLGDGCFRHGLRISSKDQFIIDEVASRSGAVLNLYSSGTGCDYGITFPGEATNAINSHLREYGLWMKKSGGKFIPEDYLSASIDQWLLLLQGLMDTDGTIDKRCGSSSFTTVSKRLADGVCQLVLSLGGSFRISEKENTFKGIRHKNSYNITVRLPNSMCPFRLPRKAKHWRPFGKYPPSKIIRSIEPCGTTRCACIKVDAEDSLYVTENYIVTHNTYTLGWLPLWFLDCFRPSQVISLAPKEDQLRVNLWKEIGRFWPQFQKLHPQAKMMDLQIRMKPEAEDKMSWGMVGYAAGVGAEETTAVRAHGFHAEHMLIIFEEGPGVNRGVVKAFRNTAVAPHNIIMMVGNPDADHDPLGEFSQGRDCYNIRISSLDHPNLVLNNPSFISGACTWESTEEILWDEAGGDKSHPMYESRVRGLTPTVSSRSLFSAKALKAAKDCLIDPPLQVFYHDDDERGVEGETHILREPNHEFLNRYVLFMDVAGDDIKGDWHAAILWDRVGRCVAAVVHMRGLGIDYINACLRVAKMYSVPDEQNIYGRPLICWETNGVGAHFHNISPELRSYPNLYWRRNIEASGARPRKVYGWHSSASGREKLVQELKGFNRELMYYPDRLASKLLFEECRTFTLHESGSGSKYSASDGYYDDLVMALGGALIIDRVTDPPLLLPKKEEKEDNPMMNERFRRMMRHNQAQSGDPFDVPFSKLAGLS